MTWRTCSTSYGKSTRSMSNAVSYEEYLARYGSLTYTIVGTSMLPLIRQDRDLITVVPKEGRCRVGDVVLYRRPPTRWVLHRVVAVRPEGYLTLGDNCVAREHAAEDDVIAVMTGFVRDGRAHAVDELGYRAYTWAIVALEKPRVLAKRIFLAARRKALEVIRHAR